MTATKRTASIIAAVSALALAVTLAGCAQYQQLWERVTGEGETVASPVAVETPSPTPTRKILIPATPGPDEGPPPIPKGYKSALNGLAFKWVEEGSNDFDCSYYDTCVVLRVYAYNNCPSLVYVSANALDANGTVVDYSNDTVPGLLKGKKALMTLGSLDSRVVSFELTDLACS